MRWAERNRDWLNWGWVSLLGLLLLGPGGSGCSESASAPTPGSAQPPQPEKEDPYDPACPTLTLDLLPLDIWGQALADVTLEVRNTAGEVVQRTATGGLTPVRVGLPPPGAAWQLGLTAPAHRPALLQARYLGGRTAADLELTVLTVAGEPPPPVWAPLVPGLARSLDPALIEGLRCPLLTLYVGLDHELFAAGGRPARDGNAVALMIDGEEQWAQAAADLRTARERVAISTWWWQSDFELERGPDQPELDEAARWPQTILGILETLPHAVSRQILVARFLPESLAGSENLNTDTELRSRARDPASGFEVLVQGNPTPVPATGEVSLVRPGLDFTARVQANRELSSRTFEVAGEAARTMAQPLAAEETFLDAASYHQKALLIDDRIGYVGGMNIKSSDWDTQDHLVFDRRRMKFKSSLADRQAVAEKRLLPDLGPRKDYFLRFEGPLVTELDDLFCARWELARAEQEPFFEQATPCVRHLWAGGVPPGSVKAQLVATLPAPWHEVSILESLAKGIAQARELIFIEDQYFRMPILNDLLVEALVRNPELHLVVITKDVAATDGGKRWTYLCDQQLRAAAAERYHLFQLKSFDVVTRQDELGHDQVQSWFVALDTHSKLVIIDDDYLNVGSCNKNNRGLKFEGELNVVVWDAPFVQAQLRRVFAQLLGPDRARQLTGQVEVDVRLLEEAAVHNAAQEAWWQAHQSDPPAQLRWEFEQHRPEGFLYPLTFDELADFPEVGPDLF